MKKNILYPLNSWKHWLVWFILALGVSGVAFLFSKLVVVHISFWMFVAVFLSWLFSLAIFDTFLHKMGLQ
jgi:hypothetical protein